MTHLYIYITLAALVAFFPKDALLFPLWAAAQIKLHYVNARTFWFAWTTYCKLKKEMAEQGWPIPPFKFVPIWEREL